MKKLFVVLGCVLLVFTGCLKIENTGTENIDLQNKTTLETVSEDALKIGDEFLITGTVDYSDKPSDIGQEYCFVTGDKEIEYCYMDIYDKESKWQSNVFYTKGDDTALLKDYVGCEVTISGIFDAECHGIPYITQIEVLN